MLNFRDVVYYSVRKNSMATKRIVVTGMGAVTPLGMGIEQLWRKLLKGECGITSIEDEKYEKIPSKVAGFVQRSNETFNVSKLFSVSEQRQFSDASLFTSCAAEEALTDAQWKPTNIEDCKSTGVSIGSSIMSLDYLFSANNFINNGIYKKVHPQTIPRALINMPAGYVSMKYNFMGACNSVSTACATGAHSIIDGFNLIRNNDCTVVVCGAADSQITPTIVAGFSRCKALSTKFNNNPQQASRPFDKDRDGFVIAEGAGILVLEDFEHARYRGAKVYAEILGYGLSSDAYHITNPRPDAMGITLCMQRAISKSKIESKHIGYVNAHATSTPVGDKAEGLAIENVFGDYCHSVRISSIKGATGHLLAAAGSVESIATILSCSTGVLPPSINLNCYDEKLKHLNFVTLQNLKWPTGINDDGRRIALKNSFGFGGTNASIVFASVSKDDM
ncbi:3-oxoacyl-[acyl-carrier-protein] synthase, mitochondrial [Nymphon striatum]|nr:3-oxoacyl-[acyl-carrier-protein] synthase, mitochondrial [Nymphon striatum]KAG1682043.1 3-oxoacyl-[acyl-carrier-protein] synthase, mitochondrial [Nymphon striatum]